MSQFQQFNLPLSYVLRVYKSSLPPVMRQAMEFIDTEEAMKTEFIFRKSARLERIETLREVANKGHHVEFQSPHEAAALIKLYLREMTEPIIPSVHYDTILAFTEEPTEWRHGKPIDPKEMMILRAVDIIEKCPRDHKPFLWKLFKLLAKIAEREEANRMNADALGKMIGPNICWAKNEVLMKPIDMPALSYFATFLIEQSGQLFKYDPENFLDGAWGAKVVNRNREKHLGHSRQMSHVNSGIFAELERERREQLEKPEKEMGKPVNY